MSPYYPVLLQLAGKRCLIIGSNWAAEEKTRGLLEAGALVTIIAPSLTPQLQELVRQGRIAWEQREYRAGDLDGFFLVVAARDDRGLNEQIWREANERNALLNSFDDPKHCNFIYPAIHRQGDLILTVSSSGKSPAVATRLRDRFAAELGPEYAELLAILGALREEIARKIPDFEERKRVWYQLVDSEALDLIRQSDINGARATLRAILDRVPE